MFLMFKIIDFPNKTYTGYVLYNGSISIVSFATDSLHQVLQGTFLPVTIGLHKVS